jgi:hypothetical protein
MICSQIALTVPASSAVKNLQRPGGLLQAGNRAAPPAAMLTFLRTCRRGYLDFGKALSLEHNAKSSPSR